MEHRERPGLEPWYVTGLVDGDGSFTYSRSSRGASPLTLYFAIKLTKKDDDLLEKVRAYFNGVGKIYPVRARSPRYNSGFTKRASYFRVSKTEELAGVVEHFDRYRPQGRRREVYGVWREMYEIKKGHRDGGPMSPEAREQLDELAERLSSLSPRNRPWDGEEE
mgnify:FL=1